MNKSDNPLSLKNILAGIIITVVGGVILAYIIQDAIFSPQQPTPPTQSTIAFSDSFDGSASGYDTNLWVCGKECGAENLFLKDGVLNLQRSQEGLTYIVSRSRWDYRDLASLSGKFRISSDLNHGELSWLSIHDLHDNAIGCGFHGTETPYLQCDVSPERQYVTSEMPLQFDTWYSIEIGFNQNPDSIKFYVDNTLIGEYILTDNPDTMQVDTGISSSLNMSSGQIIVDDIVLTLNK